MVATFRLKLFDELEPSFTAVGNGGFDGYIVFGFEDEGVYVLENLRWGNATYVFGKDWEALSQLTKAEIIRGDLQKERLVHAGDWEGRVRNLLSS